MKQTAPSAATAPEPPRMMGVREAGALPTEQVLQALGGTAGGLSTVEYQARRERFGPNAVRSHGAHALPVLMRQLRSPLLVLLAVTAIASFFLGERTDAVIIGVILAVSVGLGFFNEYRAERSAQALHDQITHRVTVLRGGEAESVDVVELVPGDVVELRLGEVVPADIRLISATGVQCDESVLTGEALPVGKSVEPVPSGSPVAQLSGCALMGTVVTAGAGRGVVVATGAAAEFGRIALSLGAHHPETEFQVGLRRFSGLLVQVAAVLTGGIFVVNLVLDRPLLDALLFSLAIAVGISPQLLPAVVSTSLAAGSRQLARRKVLVKRLLCIEDLGDTEVLFTDKTGTLTEGRIEFMRALGPDGSANDDVLLLGLVCSDEAVDGNPLDAALWQSPGASRDAVERYERLAVLPFDHRRRLTSVLVDTPAGARILVTKGAPEAVLERCPGAPKAAAAVLETEFAAGHRVVAVATRSATGPPPLEPSDERDLTLCGFLVFSDPPKASARTALRRLAGLGVTVKVITGDNPSVAARVCADLGLPPGDVLTGADLDRLSDADLAERLPGTTVFARVDPEQKARIVRAQRAAEVDVAFLGDGVNDALALHAADVGISVDSGTDVAKDAADVVLLEKDLQVLADGVVEGRRVFANTIKYVLMGTSSNFGNMFSAAGASAFLSFLPMLPSQILLNNLLYDTSQLAIPTDTVDAEQLERPSRWDIGLIRRFMLVFGPVSSLFDFVTFAVMLQVFHAGPVLFRTGWFVESLATQTLVLFVIRTRRSPFYRSRPSVPLLTATLAVVAAGAVLPATPLAGELGFAPLPGLFFFVLVLMISGYVVLVELAKRWFFRTLPATPVRRARVEGYRTHRRAARFSSAARPAVPRNR
ncbi:magnesium-translocating P-type ATPase [Amycolatopsis benzoatilytica]|uniref:magnesium-translocating P-type ATPase n=1 Tax=Amycolatopsis benzoatilytica TaxID=346045 RepID=UPI000368F0EC|nr:magnesium-translocating P-type ATPase [Amycolatopsis benzoatilytica]